ncbi:hypothetical protein ADUPG1_011618, partial [Aduncisulcus paluster]
MPCPWCMETGTNLLLPHLSSPLPFKLPESVTRTVTSGQILNPNTPNVPLFFHSLYSSDIRLLIPHPFRLHSGDILHILHIGLTNDMNNLLAKILKPDQKDRFNKRMKLLGLRTQVGCGLRDGNDSRHIQHFSSICLFELENYRSTRDHSFDFLYDDRDIYEDSPNIMERITISSPSIRVAALSDVVNLRFVHVLLMSGIINQFAYEIRDVSTDEECDNIIVHVKRFIKILSPLCVKGGIYSNNLPIKKIKTHLLMHLKEWVRDGGPLINYSAETGERINASIYRLYRYIRTQPTCHNIADLSLPFIVPENKIFVDHQIRFKTGKFYLFKDIELDDAIIQFISHSEDKIHIRGQIYKYFGPASIGY